MAHIPICIIESPYAGITEDDLLANVSYAREAMRRCLLAGFAPFASHLLYTQEGVLNDNIPKERALGIDAGLALRQVADIQMFFVDRGLSSGMLYALKVALVGVVPLEFVSICNNDSMIVIYRIENPSSSRDETDSILSGIGQNTVITIGENKLVILPQEGNKRREVFFA